jgi:hypothetical protein
VMTYTYKKFMRDGSVEIRTGSRMPAQVRIGKTAKDRRRSK